MSILYWILCFIIGLIPAWLLFRQDRKRHLPIKWLPSALRFLTIFFATALLLAPAFPQHKTIEKKPLVLWLQDGSASMKIALGKDSSLYKKKRKAFLSTVNNSYQIIPLTFGKGLKSGINNNYSEPATNISAALQDAVLRYQNQNIGAIILSSDGNFNLGSDPIYALPDKKIPIYTIGIGDSTTKKDLLISFVKTNKSVALGNQFEVLVNVKALKLKQHHTILKISHKGHILAQESFKIEDNNENKTFRFYLNAKEKGLQKFKISLEPINAEINTENNQKFIFVDIIEKKINILIAADAPHPDIAAIKEALRNHPEYSISIKYAQDIPAQVSHADLLITHDLPNKDGFKIPKHDNIPSWNILGSKTDLNTFSKNQNILTIKTEDGFANLLPQLNSNFNLFVLPANIREVLAQMPPLSAANGQFNLQKGQILFQQQNTEKPLWVIYSGKPAQAILVGTGIWRWRLYSYKFFKQSDAVDALIQRTVNLLTNQSKQKPFQITLNKHEFQEQEPIQINATLKNAEGTLVNQEEAQLVLTDSNGHQKKYLFQQSGNSYQCNIGNLPAGQYQAAASVLFNNKKMSDKTSFIVLKTSLENMTQSANYALLYKLSKNTNGLFFTIRNMQDLSQQLDHNAVIKPVIREETNYINWINLKYFFFIILITATTEWLLRKYWGI